MEEDQPFLAAISAARDDDTVRLIYAGWLEERGDVRSEYLRLLCALAALPQRQARKRKPLQARLQQLRASIDPDWRWAVARRKSVEETWRHLEKLGYTMPRDAEDRPLVPLSMPNYDDDDPRFSYFRTRLKDEDRSDLSLPRTYFGRSWFIRVSFAETDLSESRMCWNDFDGCDFSGADMSRCDMRASIFRRCKLVGAILRGADVRRSTFKDCDFAGAELSGTMAENADFQGCVFDFLTREQQAVMVLTEDEGPEPPGG
jgi:uncharacterized protein (TIGR02996 family)